MAPKSNDSRNVKFVAQKIADFKEISFDLVLDTVHEMARDEARHGRGLEGLLKRYFK